MEQQRIQRAVRQDVEMDDYITATADRTGTSYSEILRMLLRLGRKHAQRERLFSRMAAKRLEVD